MFLVALVLFSKDPFEPMCLNKTRVTSVTWFHTRGDHDLKKNNHTGPTRPVLRCPTKFPIPFPCRDVPPKNSNCDSRYQGRWHNRDAGAKVNLSHGLNR